MPAADAVDRLQKSGDPDSLLFQKFARQGLTAPSERGGGGDQDEVGVRQGTYAVTPSGILLGSANTPDGPKLQAVLEKALAKWKTLPRDQRLLPSPPDPAAAQSWREWEKQYPAGGLVLSVVCRDLPRRNVPSHWKDAWNQDYAWFRRDEARAFLPPVLEKGRTHELPGALLERMVRFHLVDHVRARDYDAWPAGSISKATLTSTVLQTDGDQVSLRLEGAARAAVSAPKSKGYDARMLGRATYDRRRERFVAFELVAVGSRWGEGNCNQRHSDPGPAPMGVAFTLAGGSAAEKLPPAFLSDYGWDPKPGKSEVE